MNSETEEPKLPRKKKRRKRRKWKFQKGGKRPHTKLTEAQVHEIWSLLYEGRLSQFEIAEMFGVVQETISHIACGRRWTQVTGLQFRGKDAITPAPTGNPQGRKLDSYKANKRKARKFDWKQLADCVIIALLKGENKCTVKFHRLIKFPDDFPNTKVIEKEYKTITAEIWAKPLLTWLYKKGHTNISYKDVMKIANSNGLQFLLASNKVGLDIFNDLLLES